jgi:putative flippase GtrA
MSIVKRQLTCFVIIGVISVIIDFSLYKALSSQMDFGLAKAVSFIVGTFFSYIANKVFTFQQYGKNFKEFTKFLGLYFFSLCVNVLVNKITMIILVLLSDFELFSFLVEDTVFILAFLAATFVSMTINFVGQKFFVFRN